MIKKAYSRKRVVFYFSILLVVFTILTTPYVLSESIDESCHICFSKKNQRTNSQLTKQERNLFLDMCKYKAIDFIKINAEIDNRYPEYSDVKALLIALGKFEKKIDAELIVDFVELNKKGLIPSRKELIKMTKLNKPWKPPINAKEYWFTKRCPKPNDNETNWSIHFLTNWSIHFLTSSDDKITAIQLNPYMDNDKNFSTRQIKFNFDYFSSTKSMKKILQNLMKLGTTRKKVLDFMDNNVEVGVYSKNFRKKEQIIKQGSKNSTFVYISIDKPKIAMRTILFEFKTMINLDFDESKKLISIQVQR